MEKWNKESFKKLKKEKKYLLLKNHGNFIANRISHGYQCSLFAFSGMHVEIWRPLGLNYIHWIEIVESPIILEEYMENIKKYS